MYLFIFCTFKLFVILSVIVLKLFLFYILKYLSFVLSIIILCDSFEFVFFLHFKF